MSATKYPKGTSWIFTLFKMDTNIKQVYENNKDKIRYIIANPEKCPKTEKLHFNGFIQLFGQQRRSFIQKIFNTKCFCKVANGGLIANQEYCSKIKTQVGDTLEFGNPIFEAKRCDINNVKQMINNNYSMKDVADKHFNLYIRYHKGFEKYQELSLMEQGQKRRTDLKVILIHGSTGIGKTRYVMDKHGDENIFIIDFVNNKEWWNGYRGQKIILFDDYNNNLSIERFLRLTDIYKCRLPTKGGFVWALWDFVYITTNLDKNELHPDICKKHKIALNRRITEVIDEKKLLKLIQLKPDKKPNISLSSCLGVSGNTDRDPDILLSTKEDMDMLNYIHDLDI